MIIVYDVMRREGDTTEQDIAEWVVEAGIEDAEVHTIEDELGREWEVAIEGGGSELQAWWCLSEFLAQEEEV